MFQHSETNISRHRVLRYEQYAPAVVCTDDRQTGALAPVYFRVHVAEASVRKMGTFESLFDSQQIAVILQKSLDCFEYAGRPKIGNQRLVDLVGPFDLWLVPQAKHMEERGTHKLEFFMLPASAPDPSFWRFGLSHGGQPLRLFIPGFCAGFSL